MQIDFQKCRENIAGYLNEFYNRWCKREHVECDALKDWKLNIFKIIDRRIFFYSQNTNMLPSKPKINYRYLKSGLEEFHRKYGAGREVRWSWVNFQCRGVLQFG